MSALNGEQAVTETAEIVRKRLEEALRLLENKPFMAYDSAGICDQYCIRKPVSFRDNSDFKYTELNHHLSLLEKQVQMLQDAHSSHTQSETFGMGDCLTKILKTLEDVSKTQTDSLARLTALENTIQQKCSVALTEKEMSDLRKETVSFKEQISSDVSIDASQPELDIKTDKKKLKLTVSKLKKELDQIKHSSSSQMADLEKRADVLETREKETKRFIDKLHLKMKDLSKNLQELMMEDEQEWKDERKAEIEAVQTKIDDLKEKLEDNTDDIKTCMNQIAELQDQEFILTSDLQQLQFIQINGEKVTAESEVSKLNFGLEALFAEIEDMNKKIAALETNSVNSTVGQLKAAVENLQTYMLDKDSESCSQAQASAYGCARKFEEMWPKSEESSSVGSLFLKPRKYPPSTSFQPGLQGTLTTLTSSQPALQVNLTTGTSSTSQPGLQGTLTTGTSLCTQVLPSATEDDSTDTVFSATAVNSQSVSRDAAPILDAIPELLSILDAEETDKGSSEPRSEVYSAIALFHAASARLKKPLVTLSKMLTRNYGVNWAKEAAVLKKAASTLNLSLSQLSENVAAVVESWSGEESLEWTDPLAALHKACATINLALVRVCNKEIDVVTDDSSANMAVLWALNISNFNKAYASLSLSLTLIQHEVSVLSQQHTEDSSLSKDKESHEKDPLKLISRALNPSGFLLAQDLLPHECGPSFLWKQSEPVVVVSPQKWFKPVKFQAPGGHNTMMNSNITTNIATRHQCITAMKENEDTSLEELQWEDMQDGRKPRKTVEQVPKDESSESNLTM